MTLEVTATSFGEEDGEGKIFVWKGCVKDGRGWQVDLFPFRLISSVRLVYFFFSVLIFY